MTFGSASQRSIQLSYGCSLGHGINSVPSFCNYKVLPRNTRQTKAIVA